MKLCCIFILCKHVHRDLLFFLIVCLLKKISMLGVNELRKFYGSSQMRKFYVGTLLCYCTAFSFYFTLFWFLIIAFDIYLYIRLCLILKEKLCSLLSIYSQVEIIGEGAISKKKTKFMLALW